MKYFISLLLTAFLLNSYNKSQNKEKPTDQNSSDIYLGQKPPGLIPELFAPDIIKNEYREAAAAISPDLKEFYFRRRGGHFKKNALVVVKNENGRWSESLVDSVAGEPFISPDGRTMHLGKKYRKRASTGWSEEKNLGTPFTEYRIMRLTTSTNGTYYFDEASENGPLRYSRLIDGMYEAPKTLTVEVGKWNAHPFIASDESYIIWDDQRESGYGGADLYISFRQKDDSWGPSLNLGDKINTEFEDAYGSVSPDGKYFFFHRSYGSNKADIFWVDAQFINALRLKN